jgi:hypothetical protein
MFFTSFKFSPKPFAKAWSYRVSPVFRRGGLEDEFSSSLVSFPLGSTFEQVVPGANSKIATGFMDVHPPLGHGILDFDPSPYNA